MSWKFNIHKRQIWLYFVLGPFIYPRGFNEYFPLYKTAFTLWLYFAIAIIMVYFIIQTTGNNISINRQLICILLYFGLMLVETLINLGNINEGLQKIFATPALCMLCIMYLKKNLKEFINVLGNLLLFVTGFNCTFFNPYIFLKIVGKSDQGLILFIGHVQTAAQIGTLGIIIAVLLYRIGNKNKAIVLIVTSLTTMLISDTTASYGCLALIIIAYIAKNILWKLFQFIKYTYIFNIMCILNSGVIAYVLLTATDFGARYFIWIQVLEKMRDHFLYGYGVYGTLLKPFWVEWEKNSQGMNYAHNELLQHLLDGGIILLIAFIILINVLLKDASKIKNIEVKYWSSICLLTFMMDCVCDSVSEYNYFYLFIIILAFLPEMENTFSKNSDYYKIRKTSKIKLRL